MRRPRRTIPRRLLLPLLAVLAGTALLAWLALAGRPAGDGRRLLTAGASVVIAGGVLWAWLVAARASRAVARLTAWLADPSGHPVPRPDAAELRRLAESLGRVIGGLTTKLDHAQEIHRTRDAVLSTMREGVVLVEAEGRIGYVNGAAERILGSVPRTSSALTPISFQRLIGDARSRGDIVTEEIELGLPPRVLRVSALPVGGGGRVVLVLRDVTQARRVEAMRRDFVTNASHELKTPVASIQAAAETVGAAIKEDREAAERFTEQLGRDATRLAGLVDDLLDLSRLETEQPDMEPLRLDVVAKDEVERLTDRARQDDIDLGIESASVDVHGSRKDLALLVRNLLDNAVRYTAPGGRVRVVVRSAGDRAILEIADTGIGIPSRDLPRIFERFYRVDPARSRRTGGTGLGLSIARHVAEQHGGSIEAESELGRGTTMRVTLPAA